MTLSLDVVSDRKKLMQTFRSVRATTEALCEPLEPEDMVVQTMPDVSPTKWHMAHVTWFFETLVLARSGEPYTLFDERFHALFNSYYQSLGSPYPRDRRGLLSRPTVDEVRAYRRFVDAAMIELLERAPDRVIEEMAPVITLGVHHEQQHQELLLMDVKHVLASNPLRPAYRVETAVHDDLLAPLAPPSPLRWQRFSGGQVEVGSEPEGFLFDNERPRHTVLLEPFELAARPVTVGEYLAFMADDGYERAELWLADGWERVRNEGWKAPLYWETHGEHWRVMTLTGLRELDPTEPVCHVSYFEADAFATWAGARLPTEFEWEHATESEACTGTLLESGALHPRPDPSRGRSSLTQLFGDVWEWTSSPYVPYPGYRPFEGELGEYNGKFMINQMVLRGGCCVTPEDHLRRTYRNFYYPHQRWMFSGLRLAR